MRGPSGLITIPNFAAHKLTAMRLSILSVYVVPSGIYVAVEAGRTATVNKRLFRLEMLRAITG